MYERGDKMNKKVGIAIVIVVVSMLYIPPLSTIVIADSEGTYTTTTDWDNGTKIGTANISYFYSEASLDGLITSYDANNYSEVLNGIGDTLSAYNNGINLVGVSNRQSITGSYQINRGYLSFNTSTIPSDVEILSAVLYIKVASIPDYSDVDFDVNVTNVNYGEELDKDDWNATGTYEGVLLNTTNLIPSTWYEMNVNISGINNTGRTQYMLTSSREGTVPAYGTLEDAYFYSGNMIYKPYLQINTITKLGTTTKTDRYKVTNGNLELDFPFAKKDASLLGYWRMEGDCVDETWENNGTWIGVSNTTGKFGNCFEFDGIDDYIDCGNDSSLDFNRNGDYTYTGWFKTNNISVEQGILDHKVNDSYEGGVAIMIKDNKLKFYTGSEHDLYGRTEELSSNVWYHFAIVYSNQDIIDMYINGTTNGTNDVSYYKNSSSDDCLYIGRSICDGGNYYFNGTLDEIKIYNRTLNDTEISNLYNSGNQYARAGSWVSPLITTKPTKDALNNITVTLNNSWVGICIDKIEILNSTNAIISTDNTDLITNGTIVRNSTTFNNGFNGTYFNGTFKICISLKGDGDYTPTVENMEYTTTNLSGANLSEISDVTITPNPQLRKHYVNITANITDDLAVDSARVNITLPNSSYQNNTMSQGTGDTWYYNSTYNQEGQYIVVIWAKDNLGQYNNSEIFYFNMTDDAPELWGATTMPTTTHPGDILSIYCNVTDDIDTPTVWVNITDPSGNTQNMSMNLSHSYVYIYNITYSVYAEPGTYTFTVWANDTNGQFNSTIGSFELELELYDVTFLVWRIVLIVAIVIAIVRLVVGSLEDRGTKSG